MHVYCAHIAHVIIFPNRFQQRLAAVYLAAMGDEQLKQVKFLSRQAHRLAAEHHRAALAVDLQVMHTDDALFLLQFALRLAAAEDGLDARLDFQNIKGLGHVIVRAVFKAENLIHILALGGQHDDRHIALFANALTDLNAVHARQHHIQQNQVVFPGEKLGQRLFAVHGGIGLIPVLLQAVF